MEDSEISWLRFDDRVLQEAQDKNNPLYERLHFISIFNNNLDKFYMTRVGTLIDTGNVKKDVVHKKEIEETKKKLKSIYKFMEELLTKKDCVYDDIMQQFQTYSVSQITDENITEHEQDYLREYFESQIFPVLSPVIIDKKQHFPFINNKQMIIAVSFESENDQKIGIVPVITTLQRIVLVPDTEKIAFILLEDLICMFAGKIFRHKVKNKDKAIIRITRNADIDESDVPCGGDIKESVTELIQMRAKMAPIRMECIGSIENSAIQNTRKALTLDKKQVFHQSAPLDMSFIQELKAKLPQQEYVRCIFQL